MIPAWLAVLILLETPDDGCEHEDSYVPIATHYAPSFVPHTPHPGSVAYGIEPPHPRPTPHLHGSQPEVRGMQFKHQLAGGDEIN